MGKGLLKKLKCPGVECSQQKKRQPQIVGLYSQPTPMPHLSSLSFVVEILLLQGRKGRN